MGRTSQYQVLLYYKYVQIEDPETYAAEHLQFCQTLDLKGRILVAHEGINGTVSGTIEQTDRYMEAMHADSRFADMTFKIDPSDKHTFKKMHVRHRNELVTLRLDRKSTRLNSSHVAISYAVFCLKKKK